MYIQKLLQEEALEIYKWKYPGIYAFYNSNESEEGLRELMENSYYSVRNEQEELIGFFCFGSSAQVPSGVRQGHYTGEDLIDIGLGMKPEWTGMGRGPMFLEAGLSWLRDNPHPPHQVRLTVADFNARAKALYKKAGFKEIASFESNGTLFLIMTRRL